jgi:hypothetical protein
MPVRAETLRHGIQAVHETIAITAGLMDPAPSVMFLAIRESRIFAVGRLRRRQTAGPELLVFLRV